MRWLSKLAAAVRALLHRAPPAGGPGSPEGGDAPREGLRSRGEMAIAGYLARRGLEYEYEPVVGGFTPDFVLRRERVIIEYWGMKGKYARYDAKIATKKRRYAHHGYRLIGVERRHLRNLESHLDCKLGLGPGPGR